MSFDNKFQVNLGGVIRLLSDHLYSSPEVYVRELLQNAVDAITARQQFDGSRNLCVRIELTEATDSQPTLMVEDEGIGLTQSEVHEFLATIGQSSKSGDFSREGFIGQFGIGLLSGFLVCDEITVITCSAKGGHKPVEWKGRSDGTYSVRELDSDLVTGTRVYLRCKPDKRDYFQPERLLELLRHYGQLLPYDIHVSSGGKTECINEPAPWNLTYPNETARREACLAYGKSIFGIEFTDIVPLQSESGDIQGLAFVLPFAASPSARQSHRVYLKNMLLAESVDGLLPDWAFFVRCVLNSNQLRPNAARDSFYEDDNLQQARATLSLNLRQYLTGLAEFNRDRLNRIINLHYMPIKALAVEDSEFMRLFIDWLPFETTLGRVTLGEYCQSSSRIRYVPSVEQFQQISSIASAQGLCIFNAGYAYDNDLLEQVAQEFPNRSVQRVDPNDLVQNLDELTLDESEKAFDLIKVADLALQKYKCAAVARKFAPDHLPVLYTANASADFLRTVEQSREQADDMWGDVLDGISFEAQASSYAQMVFNFRNPLIQRLATVHDRDLLSRVIEILYLQSLLLGNYPLAGGERRLLAEGLLGLVNLFLDGKQG